MLKMQWNIDTHGRRVCTWVRTQAITSSLRVVVPTVRAQREPSPPMDPEWLRLAA